MALLDGIVKRSVLNSMSQTNDDYKIYAVTIKFEGEITIPCSNPDFAEIEVRKALRDMCKPYEIWDDFKDPSFSTWWDGCAYETKC